MSKMSELALAVQEYKLSKINLYDIPPAWRGDIDWLAEEMGARMRKQGVYATARYMEKRGFPVELAIAAIYH